MSTADTPADKPTHEQLKQAFKAFRKRLKLTRLEEESKISRRPVTGGRQSSIVAIVPPNQFPQAVWDELVRQGKLKKAGHGTYELVEE
ncbi:MAG: hypothetical protein IT429_16475 [Gemmataceae bacterium]|nr:hypothetical protein [Gemmataceae bacterium]